MEKDDEVCGATGTSYDFGARLLDPRVGRWLSLDPIASKFPDISLYAFVHNMPTIAIDPSGQEIYVVTGKAGEKQSPELTKSTLIQIINVLSTTKDGLMMLNQYVGSSENHLYINIGPVTSQPMSHSYGTTVNFGPNQITLMLDANNTFTNRPETEAPELDAFNGLKVAPGAKSYSFMTLNIDNFGGEQGWSFNSNESGYLPGAETLGHEIGAHGGEDIGHEAWGQADRGKAPTPKSKAASLLWQLKNRVMQNAIDQNFLLTPEESQPSLFRVVPTPKPETTPTEPTNAPER